MLEAHAVVLYLEFGVGVLALYARQVERYRNVRRLGVFADVVQRLTEHPEEGGLRFGG